MINTVIFDMDGLLINSEIVTYKLYRSLVEEYGYTFSIEEYIHEYCGRLAERNMNALIEEYHLPITTEEGLAYMSQKETEYIEKGIPLKPGAAELLSYLKENDYKILIASSSSTDRATSILKNDNVYDYFEYKIFGEDVTKGKPDPEIFAKACDYAGEPPRNCLVLEDSEAGIQAAHAAGANVICVPDMKSPSVQYRNMLLAELPALNNVIPWLRTNS